MTARHPSSGPAHRRRVVALAGHTGDPDTARNGLQDPEPVVRGTALGALHRLGALRPDELRHTFVDPAVAVRRRAAEVAAHYPSVSLLDLLQDSDSTVVEVAAWSCGEHEVVPDEVLARLIALATAHSDPLVREACVAALGAIGDERGLDAILAGCRDKPAVRRRAVLALAPFEGDEVEAAIAAALTDRDWQVRQAAEDLVR
ncbi:MAG TPA: HEAT repeat domain-containing protein [Ilumatobacteraceae bacterium]